MRLVFKVRASTLCRFYSLISFPNLSEGAESVGGQSPVLDKKKKKKKEKKECPFSGVASSGRVWRKRPESDARCVI